LNSDDKFEILIANKGKASLKEKNELIELNNKQREQPASVEQSLTALLSTGQYSAESMMEAIKSGTSPNTNGNCQARINTLNGTDKTNGKTRPRDESIKPLAGETNERNEIGQSPAKLNKPPTESNSTSPGWIEMHRKSLENGWLRNHKLWTFLTYCFLKASHKKRTSKIGHQSVELQPGEFIFGRKKASEETKLSIQEIRTCVTKLKKAGNLTIKSTNKYSIVAICKWGDLL